ncbi:MAG TPA: MFS transporter [Vicinamibacterales bacterium]|nr:MFS transporter [Vicinamibacterales bacterium]
MIDSLAEQVSAPVSTYTRGKSSVGSACPAGRGVRPRSARRRVCLVDAAAHRRAPGAGLGGALLVPASLALVGSHFEEHERGRAIGTWAGASALTTALGPVLGGWLVDQWSWPAVFLLVAPLAGVTVAICWWRVPVSPVRARAYFGVFRLVLGEDCFAGLSDKDRQAMVDLAFVVDEVVDRSISEHSLNPQSIEASITKALPPARCVPISTGSRRYPIGGCGR